MRRFILALVPLALVACAEQTPVDPAAPATLATPSFDWTNNPDPSNPKFDRGELHWITCWTDPANGLRVCSGTLPLGGGTEPDCGLQEPGDPIEYQDVYNDVEDAFSPFVHSQVKGDVFITVRDQTQAGDCFGDALVAQGEGQFKYIDNDAFGIDPDDNNANAWGFKSNGALTAPDGSTMMYNGHLRFRCNTSTGCTVTSVLVNVH